MRYIKVIGFVLFLSLFIQPAFAQNDGKKKVTPISRAAKGEIIKMNNDTIIGMIKIENAEEYYITSISFKSPGRSKQKLTAYDVKWFRQVVPYPDREAFGVDEVFFISAPHPSDSRKKVFMPAEK